MEQLSSFRGIDFVQARRQVIESIKSAIKSQDDQSDQSFLSEEQVEANYVMLCVAYPKADCKLKIEVEDELF